MLYTIKNQNTIITISSKGAELKSFNIAGKEYMHDANPKYWGRTAPNLFPNIGTIKDGYVLIDGNEYPFVKHGFLRDTEMELENQTDNSITFKLRSNPELLKKYPFDFYLTISYTINDNELTCRINVTNKGLKPMYFNFGLHPAFKVPWNENETFEEYQIHFEHPINANLPTVRLDTGLVDWKTSIGSLNDVSFIQLNHEDYANDALCIDPHPKGVIKLVSPSNESIELHAPEFRTLGIWTPYPTKAPFICLEPWIGCADAPEANHEFINKKDIIKLNVNEIWLTTYQIKING